MTLKQTLKAEKLARIQQQLRKKIGPHHVQAVVYLDHEEIYRSGFAQVYKKHSSWVQGVTDSSGDTAFRRLLRARYIEVELVTR